MKLDRNSHVAGSFASVQQKNHKEWLDTSLEDRFAYGIMMHLLNHQVRLNEFRFIRSFCKAYKRA